MVAAVIRRDGRILICQRRRGEAHHPLKWEFPGGKVEPGESPVQALARELAEELDIRARIGREIERYSFRYPGKNPILLIFYEITEFSGEPCNLVFEQFCWESGINLPGYDFLEGDVDFVRRLSGAA